MKQAAPTPLVAKERAQLVTQRIQQPVVAGSWYPDDQDQLAKFLDGYLAAPGKRALDKPVLAVIAPHAGYRFSGKAAATVLRLLQGHGVKRVVVLAVSHHRPFRGAAVLDATHYRTPLGLVPIDRQAVDRLRQSRVVRVIPDAFAEEHSLEIQLPLLQRVLPGFSLVPLLISGMEEADYRDLAAALVGVLDEHTAVVASSDFTHRGPDYGYEVPPGLGTLQERLAQLDQGAIDEILKLDRPALLAYQQRTKTTICGIGPIAVLLELLHTARDVRGEVVARYASGDIANDWTNSVSYVAVAFTGQWPRPSALQQARSSGSRAFPLSIEEKRALLRLARESLEASVRGGRFVPAVLERRPLPEALGRKAGAFVTLKCKMGPSATCIGKGEDLRGCIGTILPVTSVRETVAQRAASAALEDSRFPRRVGVDELSFITVEVSVLTPPRPVRSAGEVVIGQHGIILDKDGHGATFLPQVAPEQGWDRETTLRHLALKAGLDAEDWREGASLSVYEAIVFAEGEQL